MDYDKVYEYVDTETVSISLSKTNLRKINKLSSIGSKNSIKFAAPVILPKVARQKTNTRKSSQKYCEDANKSVKLAACYRVKTHKTSKSFKLLVSKRKRNDQPNESVSHKKLEIVVGEQESGGKSSQAETTHQKRQKRVNFDGSSECGGEASTSVDYLFKYYVMFGDLP